MLRGGPALASVVLCSVCLLVVLSRPAASHRGACSKDLNQQLKSLLSCLMEQTVNITLYTPTIEDYTKCPRSTFTCFADEMKVLQTELKLSGIACPTSVVIKGLYSVARRFEQLESKCCQCELHQEQRAELFVKAAITTVQAMNTQYCERTKDGLQLLQPV